MIMYSQNGVIEDVMTMIRTGASEDCVGNYIDNLYNNGKVTERIYSLLLGIFIDNY